jgi:GAF domain-containing protein
VAEHGETLLVPETENDPRLKTALGDRSRAVRSVIALPLRGRKGTHGVIEIFNPRADQLTDYTIAFLHILADHAAIAIENCARRSPYSAVDHHRRLHRPLQRPPSLRCSGLGTGAMQQA